MRWSGWAISFLWLVSCAEERPQGPAGDSDAAVLVTFEADVRPIFARKCAHCHFTGATPPRSDLFRPYDKERGIVDMPNTWPDARDDKLVVPGKPGESFLITKLVATDLDRATEGELMPRDIPRLTVQELADLEQWIATGAAKDDLFQKKVRRMFRAKCHDCHSRDGSQRPNLDDPFDEKTGIVNVKSSRGGVQVVPGDVKGSFLYTKVARADLPATLGAPMPLKAEPMTKDEVSLIEAWVEQGAQ